MKRGIAIGYTLGSMINTYVFMCISTPRAGLSDAVKVIASVWLIGSMMGAWMLALYWRPRALRAHGYLPDGEQK